MSKTYKFVVKGMTSHHAVPATPKKFRTPRGYVLEVCTQEEVTSYTGDVEVEFDIDTIARQLAFQALRNRNGKASLNHGNVKARILSRSVSVSTEDRKVDPSYTPVEEGQS